MTERTLGLQQNFFIARIIDVNDPHRAGRVKIRVYGYHTDERNIPDNDLPWAQVLQPVTSAARGGIGTAPVGMVVGTRVFGVWLDSDRQLPLIIGSLGRSGRTEEGATENGAPVVNTNFGSIPPSGVGLPNNPYSALFDERIEITAIDSGEENIDDVEKERGSDITTDVERELETPAEPTSSSGERGATNLTEILRTVDPRGLSSVFPDLQNISESLNNILNSALNDVSRMLEREANRIIDNLSNQISRTLRLGEIQQILDIAKNGSADVARYFDALQNGNFDSLNDILSSVDEGTRTLLRFAERLNNITEMADNFRSRKQESRQYLSRQIENFTPPQDKIVTQVPQEYEEEYYSYESDPFPGYIRWRNRFLQNDFLFTLRNGKPNYPSREAETQETTGESFKNNILSRISSGNFDFSFLQNTLDNLRNEVQNTIKERLINNISQEIMQRVSGAIMNSIQGVFNSNISSAQLPNLSDVRAAVETFSRAQTNLNLSRNLFQRTFRRQ